MPQAAGNQERMFTPMAAAAIKGLGTVKTVLDIGGDINDLKGAAGDLATTGKMIELLNKYENVRPNLESHLQEYYDRQIAMMGEDILMGKSLGYIGQWQKPESSSLAGSGGNRGSRVNIRRTPG